MIRAELEGADHLKLVLVGTIDALADMSEPLLGAAMLERDVAVERIKMGGDPPWPPSKKTIGRTFTAMSSGSVGRLSFERGDVISTGGYGQTGIDEGTMLRAIAEAQPVMEGANVATIGVNVRTADGKYNYAKIFQEGSGVFAGRSAWTIEGDPLAWQVGGTWVFARRVTMQGQPPRPFLYVRGTEEKVVAIFKEWMDRLLGAA